MNRQDRTDNLSSTIGLNVGMKKIEFGITVDKFAFSVGTRVGGDFSYDTPVDLE